MYAARIKIGWVDECFEGETAGEIIDNGRIAEDGSYDELIAKDGLFADLVRRQMVEPVN